jgi:hypothetical protein
MDIINRTGRTITPDQPTNPAPVRDLLADVATVLDGHGKLCSVVADTAPGRAGSPASVSTPVGATAACFRPATVRSASEDRKYGTDPPGFNATAGAEPVLLLSG